MNAYIDTIKVTDENGEKAILYPRTKQEAVDGLEERLVNLEVADITETEDTTLENSHAGRLLFTEINGAMEQGENPSPTNPQEIENVAISGIRTHDGNGNESAITFSQPIELYGLDDVRDILTSKQIKRKYAKVVFDGSDDEAWNGSSTIGRYYMNNFGCKGYGKLMCSCAKGVQNGNEELNTCYIHAASNGRFIINTEIPTMAEWKAHLASNPMTVVYELAEETTEELPIADQIALNSIPTYDGITYVEFISDVQPTFKGEYGTSKVGGYTLESLLTARINDLRLSAVESAVINNI